MSWADDIRRLCDEGGEDLGKLCKAVKVELFSGVVSDTRWRTGRLRGNWQIQEGSAPTGEVDTLDQTGNIVKDKIEAQASEDGVTYFVNNLPYAKVYEVTDAMVARNVIRVRANIQRMADEIR